ncbi:MAG TPA: ribulose-phosphate 3-epimerase [Acidimicrobiales bacterium]|nr:ribulose-phosphate 3-epimerase [Acidimicrobiales bacterium]
MSDSERSRRVSIAPSILSADFAELARDIDCVAQQTDLLHVDVMDGHFVPNLTIGPPVVAALRRHSRAYLDCHLMITDPADYLEAFASAGASGCSVHVEVGDTDALIQQMRALGMDVGLAVNPETPFEVFAPFLGQVDLVLLMTVHPGFGGQSFMADVLPKIARTAAALEAGGCQAVIQVDGGIDATTAPRTAKAGARAFVAGSAIFGRDDPLEAAAELRRSVGGEGRARPWRHPGDD